MYDFDILKSIIFEDEVLLVVEKPAGLMVEPDRNNYPNLLTYVKKYLKNSTVGGVYAQHIHRLDRPVSGLVLFAKDKAVLRNLSEQFAQRKVRKFYKAFTGVAPNEKSGILHHFLRKEKKKAHIVTQETEFAEEVRLTYQIKELNENLYSWDVELHTGKFHQIRAQLSHLGCPIIGDAYYGSTSIYKDNQIALQAFQLHIQHPINHLNMVFNVKNVLVF